ncbi:peroxisome proliferator-activated receptor delta-like isoform X2 [Watersipora subatra]|uniref:peroxisome proliferator-activated receptor delta-like isoform X2 n=1 Tax=Watersipora subatra TaxID=2589382 RepID=UPI00355B4B26
MNMPFASTSSQTLWSFPPLDLVESCPTPTNPCLAKPRKPQAVLIDRYATDSLYSSHHGDSGISSQAIETPCTIDSSWNISRGKEAGETSAHQKMLWDGASAHSTNQMNMSKRLSNQMATIGQESNQVDIDRGLFNQRETDNIPTNQIDTDSISTSQMDANCILMNQERTVPKSAKSNFSDETCEICESRATGFYCGAFVCEACKKFYMRACKQSSRAFTCSRRSGQEVGQCEITKGSRTACSYCRYQKCLSVGMEPLGKGLLDTHSVKSLPCKVCQSPSSGFHFGVLTCEGCKGFFRRLLLGGLSKTKALLCTANWSCDVTAQSRSQCRACRYQKCLAVGMSKNAARIGRQPNSVRYARIVENRLIKGEEAELSSQSSSDITSRLQGKSTLMKRFSTSSSQLSVDSQDSAESLQSPADVSELPMDLSISCLKSCSFDLSIPTDFASCQSSIWELARLFQESCTEVSIANNDEQMVECLHDDMALSQANFLQFQRGLRIFISFAKKVKGFTLLAMEDKVLLTKCSLYRLLLLCWAQKYDLSTGRYRLFAWKSWGEVPKRFTDIYPPYKVLIYHFDIIGRKIKSTACSPEELGLLAVLVTINTDNRNDLKNADLVTQLYNNYMAMLILLTNATHPDPTQRLQELNSLLQILQKAAKEHAAAAKTVIEQYPQYAAAHAQSAQVIPALYREMFSSTPWLQNARSCL